MSTVQLDYLRPQTQLGQLHYNKGTDSAVYGSSYKVKQDWAGKQVYWAGKTGFIGHACSGGIDQWPFGGFNDFAYAATTEIGKGVCSHFYNKANKFSCCFDKGNEYVAD